MVSRDFEFKHGMNDDFGGNLRKCLDLQRQGDLVLGMLVL